MRQMSLVIRPTMYLPESPVNPKVDMILFLRKVGLYKREMLVLDLLSGAGPLVPIYGRND